MFKFVCKCGWSEGADHPPEVLGICDHCADAEEPTSAVEVEVFEDEVYREDGLR